MEVCVVIILQAYSPIIFLRTVRSTGSTRPASSEQRAEHPSRIFNWQGKARKEASEKNSNSFLRKRIAVALISS
jgi:hypothetical protein